MLQKSEKIICIKLQNLVLKKIFSELILSLNGYIDDIEFKLFNPSDKTKELCHYFISDKESITQLINDDSSKKIKKIFLFSNKPIDIKTDIEIIYDGSEIIVPIKNNENQFSFTEYAVALTAFWADITQAWLMITLAVKS